MFAAQLSMFAAQLRMLAAQLFEFLAGVLRAVHKSVLTAKECTSLRQMAASGNLTAGSTQLGVDAADLQRFPVPLQLGSHSKLTVSKPDSTVCMQHSDADAQQTPLYIEDTGRQTPL